jgi:single-strand DNA-binding protein
MAGETVITIIGNVVDEQPELRFTANGGKAVAKFRVASTPRVFDRQSNEWRDGESLFLTCSAWGPMGENAASTLQKGMRVIVQGRLKQRSYEDNQSVKRTVYELDVDEVGVSLKSATAVVTKVAGKGGQGGYGGGQQGGGRQAGGAAADDPWASSAPAGGQQGGGGWGQASSQGGGSYAGDEPPF